MDQTEERQGIGFVSVLQKFDPSQDLYGTQFGGGGVGDGEEERKEENIVDEQECECPQEMQKGWNNINVEKRFGVLQSVTVAGGKTVMAKPAELRPAPQRMA
ncbi:hypothetical protein NDU88_002389 [Pleurodeles waltl]|uniref:Uncharacterized protein n=1 Tax=Pleurodeles waltl TaxID=8319 RepID=A0AAV7W2P8_PLEWA|nr:hypothetical protein NDU88_002389 [Pleurodeles waltl]